MKKTNKSALKWVLQRSKKFLPGIFLLALIDVLLSLTMIYIALVSKDVIDRQGKTQEQIILSVVLLFATIFLQIAFNIMFSMFTVRINGKFTISIRNYMFSSLVHKKYSKVFGHHSGDLLNRFTSDTDQIVTAMTSIIPNVCATLAKIIAGIWALIIQNYIFAFIVLGIGIIIPMLGRMISKKYKYMHKEVQRTEGLARSFMQESFANIVVIKTFVSEAPIINKLNEYMKHNYDLKVKRNKISVLINNALFAFFTFGYYAVLAWGAGMVAEGALTFGTLNYFLQLISILRAPLQNISGILPQYYSMMASAERLMEIENIDDEPEIIESDELDRLKKEFECIHINNLAFAYTDEIILKNCTFDIPKNEITAITGESGSGKSTLFKILLGLYEPTGGSVTVNKTTDIDASTRGLFSYVPQGNMILSGTIRDNITLCDESISDEQIEKAAKAAVIYDYIKTLPNGFNTVLSERGAGLSEGQIQRISIARALLNDAPILLLDESTSALDEQTETQLLSNIKNMTDKTVLFITHRNTSIGVCDHIVHVEDKNFVTLK